MRFLTAVCKAGFSFSPPEPGPGRSARFLQSCTSISRPTLVTWFCQQTLAYMKEGTSDFFFLSQYGFVAGKSLDLTSFAGASPCAYVNLALHGLRVGPSRMVCRPKPCYLSWCLRSPLSSHSRIRECLQGGQSLEVSLKQVSICCSVG